MSDMDENNINERKISVTDKVTSNDTTTDIKIDINETYSQEFLCRWFLEFPSEIIQNVCDYVSSETIQNTLMKVPQLRNILIDCYYSKEIHLILSPEDETYFASSNDQRNDLIDIVTYKRIKEFLHENPDIIPHSFKLVACKNYTLVDLFFRRYWRRLIQAPWLEIYAQDCQFYPGTMPVLFTLPNLYKLHLCGTSVDLWREVIESGLERSKLINELTFVDLKICDWTGVKFPPSLSHLELSWPEYFSEPFYVHEGLPWSEQYIEGVFESISSSRIKTLKLTNSDLVTVNVSQLPLTLETIDLSSNKFSMFTWEGGSPCWPPHVKSIKLSYNKGFDDSSLMQLSSIAWPPFLETLELNCNDVTSLENLTNLPRWLKHLDLSSNEIRSFRVNHNEDGYPFFKFPEGLETLDLEVRPDFVEYPGVSESIPLEHRMRFPPNLKSLSLTSQAATRLAYFAFPLSLEILSLASTEIHDLTTYNFTLGSEEVVSWTHLTNLRELDLSHNQIQSLEYWCPPKSLRILNLEGNHIDSLIATHTPLFNEQFVEYTSNIETIDLGINGITVIDEDLVLPRNLKTLNLEAHALMDFVFTDAFASHTTLTRLDMSRGSLERIFLGTDKTYTSRLEVFDLSSYDLVRFRMTKDEFYGVFEQMGLSAVDRNKDFHSEHVFTRMDPRGITECAN